MKAVKGSTTGVHYRADLEGVALAKASALLKAQKEHPVKQRKGRAPKN